MGADLPDLTARLAELRTGLDELRLGLADRPGGGERSGEIPEADAPIEAAVGVLLFALADVARRLGVDPEASLRSRSADFRRQVEQNS